MFNYPLLEYVYFINVGETGAVKHLIETNSHLAHEGIYCFLQFKRHSYVSN